MKCMKARHKSQSSVLILHVMSPSALEEFHNCTLYKHPDIGLLSLNHHKQEGYLKGK